jgi:sugar (pentulose or hexulose) kinase
MLPKIVLPGVTIGQMTTEAAAMTGLHAGIPVVSGCTDGTAGCLASGASNPGDLNITLGTTLVFKAISAGPLIDPDGAIYNHRHPAGGFLPGAASNAGAEWVAKYFGKTDLDALSRQIADSLPSGQIAYPLVKTGERFPFSSASAKGFGLDSIDNPAARLAAGMEGIAFLERLGIEKLQRLGLSISDRIFATGGAASNETWLRIRASVNRRSYAIAQNPECAAGAAILAASAILGDCGEAIRTMVRIAKQVEPDGHLAEQYDRQYQRFCDELCQRGYL